MLKLGCIVISYHSLIPKMSEQHFTAFIEAVKVDPVLQEKLKGASDADAIVEIAKNAGYVISTEALINAQAEFSEEELEGMAGGAIWCGFLMTGPGGLWI